MVKSQAIIVGSVPNVSKIIAEPALLPVFHVGGTDIDVVKKVKYLGINTDNCLSWRCQVENTKGKVSRAISLFELLQKLCIYGNFEGHLSQYCRTSSKLLLLRSGL